MSDSKPSIAVVGGTGALGGGLAWRWAKAGRKVIVGSRGQEKAEAAQISNFSQRSLCRRLQQRQQPLPHSCFIQHQMRQIQHCLR
ncbi:MAG: NAD(P)-binding domain-containing protein [Acidobacteriota bacterium]